MEAHDAAAGVVVENRIPVADDIATLVARIADVPVTQIKPESKLGDDLGLSSIDRVELVSLIEWEKRLDLGDIDLTPDMTITDLRQLIERKKPDRAYLKFPRWGRWSVMSWLRHLLQVGALFPLFRFFVRLTVKGSENLPTPESGPYVFIANHTSHEDTAAILYALPDGFRRRLAVAAWAEFFLRPGQPVLSWLFRRVLYPLLVVLAHIYMIPQQRSPRLSLQYTGELLDHGWHVLIYPEGERHPSDHIGPFMDGLGLMVTDMRVTVIPIKLEGLDSSLPRGSAFPRFGKATLTFGQPIPPCVGEYAEIAARLREAVRRL
jgi:long-chain acyl-CoA synthetase